MGDSRELVNQELVPGIRAYISNDGVVYRDEVETLCKESGSPNWDAVLIVIPLRLGVDKLNNIYVEDIKYVFHIPQCVGILGGRPRAAFYFVAYQDDSLLYLDPHILQPVVAMIDEFPTDVMLCEI